MSGQTKQALRALFLFIPTIALCAIVVNGMIELENAPTVRLPITGYDPVDLLSGHYLRFQFDERVMSTFPSYYDENENDNCVCFTRHEPKANGQNARVSFVSCNAPEAQQCDAVTSNLDFFKNPYEGHRYYVDENLAMPLEKVVREMREMEPQSADPWIGNVPNPNLTESRRPNDTRGDWLSRGTVDVAISPSGGIRLKMLYVDNKPWMDVVSKMPQN